MIRVANGTDATALLTVYAPYIINTSLTFETVVPTEKEFADRITHYTANWPWLVWESGGNIGGYAYASRYRERTGYQWCVESSIYMDEKFMKKGVAKALYRALLELLTLQGYRNVYAVINLPNDRSVKFHEGCGFKWFATYEKVGYKLGKWKNVGWWQCSINEYTDEPPVPIPFLRLEEKIVKEVLAKHSRL